MMKNKINLLLMTIAVSTILNSCSKAYLTKTPNDALALSAAITSEADMKNALGGAYAILRNANLYGRTLPIKGDLMADNEYVSSSNSGRYTAFNNLILFQQIRMLLVFTIMPTPALPGQMK